jgi:hypothetical protein
VSSEWFPLSTLPEGGRPVEVLYADGVVARAQFAGRLPILEDGTYRYVDPVFWRPLPAAGGPGGG